MKKEDFHKGQTVWVYLTGSAARGKKTIGEKIEEWEIVSVGRKYITAKRKNSYREAKFDIGDEFKHVYTYGSADYILYLSKNDIFKDLYKKRLINEINEKCKYRGVLNKLSIEDLETVNKILSKYEGVKE